MFKNYLTVAFRNLAKHLGYSLINILGLALGMACCVLIMLHVWDELGYDRYHERSEDIYRVVQEQRFGGLTQQVAVVAAPIAPALKNDFPEIEAAVRVRSRKHLMSYGEKKFFGDRIGFVDSTFFEVFSFTLLQGNPKEALAAPGSMVMTKSLARKYFGDENPVGKAIKLDDRYDYTVTGVMADMPRNSHFNFEALAAFSAFRDEPWMTQWGTNTLWTYIRLQPGASPQALDQKLPDFVRKYRGEETVANISYYLQPLIDIHLHSNFVAEIESNGDIMYVYIFSAIAGFILLIACINYMNLSTARSAKRMREVGMRKVLGAHRSQLIRQFLAESLFLSLLALLLALVIAELALPAFNAFVGKDLALTLGGNWSILIALLLVSLLVSVFAGAYPAFMLSSYQPVTVIKGVLKSGVAGARFRRVLVVSQFAISLILMIGTAVVFQQVEYVRARHLGFNKEHLINVQVRNRGLRGKLEAFKSELLRHPQIISAAASSDPLGHPLGQSGVRLEGSDERERWLMSVLYVDADFIGTAEMKLLAGRGFSSSMASDTSDGFVLNNSAVREMGWRSPDEALGQRLVHSSGRQGPVLGVVEDFHFASLHQKIEALVMICDPEAVLPVTLRIRPENFAGTISFLEETWNRFSPGWPFEYSFLDEDLESLYRADQKVGQLFGTFAFLAIFIACLGLFGLAAFMAEQRTKEIGVRKVLGASVTGVVGLLSKDFVKLVLISNLIAWPLAYYAMKRWLEGFAYRTEMGIEVFLLATLVVLAIALMSVSGQAIRAALSNPIESLRYE